MHTPIRAMHAGLPRTLARFCFRSAIGGEEKRDFTLSKLAPKLDALPFNLFGDMGCLKPGVNHELEQNTPT